MTDHQKLVDSNTVFAQDSFDSAIAQWRVVADQLRPKFQKLSELMDGRNSGCHECTCADYCYPSPIPMEKQLIRHVVRQREAKCKDRQRFSLPSLVDSSRS